MPEKLYDMTLQQCLEHYRQGWQFYTAAGGIAGTRMETAALNPQSHSAARNTHLYYKGERRKMQDGISYMPILRGKFGPG